MIAIAILIVAAKMYARGVKISDAEARSVILARAESLDAIGNKTLAVVAKLLGVLWCFYGLLLVVSSFGYPQVLEVLDTWLWVTASILLVA